MLVVEGVLSNSADQFDAEEAERLLLAWFASSFAADPELDASRPSLPPSDSRESRFLRSVLVSVRTEMMVGTGRVDEVRVYLYRLYDGEDAPGEAEGCTVRALPHAKVVNATGAATAMTNPFEGVAV